MTDGKMHDLERIRRYETEIRRAIRERDRVSALIQRIVTPPDAMRVMGGDSGGLNLDALDKLYELEREIDRKIDAMVDLKRKAQRILDSMSDPLWAEVLELRYIEGWGIRRIAEAVYCHRTSVHRIIRQGLAEYDRLEAEA